MDGADAVMLSGETSVGNYPVQVIETMTSIIESVEDSPLINVPHIAPTKRNDRYITKSICFNAAGMADTINAKAVTTLTNSGYTAFQISAWRPHAHILVFTSNERIVTQLNLLWGVRAFFYNKFTSTDDTIDDINKICKEKKYVRKGDMVINLASMPIANKGMVNTLRISEIE
jgi:pyruvate kinase